MIDPNEAPDGFVAVEGKLACRGCFFDQEGGCGSPRSKCLRSERDDKQSVIFIPREKSNLAEFSAIGELAEARAEIEQLRDSVANQAERIRYLEGATNHATGTPLSKSKDEAARWKSSHDHVCKELAACENARDENARLCEEARDDAAKWRSSCRDRDDLIGKLKAQLTTALDAIARMR